MRRSHETRVPFDRTAKVISGTDSPVWSKLPQLESVGGKAVIAFGLTLRSAAGPDRMPRTGLVRSKSRPCRLDVPHGHYRSREVPEIAD